MATAQTPFTYAQVSPLQGFEPLQVEARVHVRDGHVGEICIQVRDATATAPDDYIQESCWFHDTRTPYIQSRWYVMEYGVYEIRISDGTQIVHKYKINVLEHERCTEARKNRKPCYIE